ncbi:MAG: hypothetical protein HY363_04265 [Candidatus Aenigmarchaeota archaeon]|nr:hypothetical protein [Candidatus Aenigmarchaeota archaeon]
MAIKHRLAGKKLIKAMDTIVVNFKNEPFQIEELYKLLREFFVEERWEGERGSVSSDANFPEDYYLQKVNPQLGREIWWRWRLLKPAFPGKTKFWRFLLDVDAHALWIKPVEIMVKDKKVKAEVGEIEIQLNAFLQYDADGTWQKSSWLSPFLDLWVKRIKNAEKTQLTKALRDEVYRIQELIKNFFSLQTYLPEKEFEAFYPKKMPE